MSLLARLHGSYVHQRRVRVLSTHFVELLPHGAHVLDVGCGDGLLAHLLTQQRPDLTLRGLDVLCREQTHIPVEPFDGQVIPYAAATVDVVMFVDVLHHTHDPMILLREAVRVARTALIIKDHTCQGFLATPTLRFLDWVGNARHGVALPYNYWSQHDWLAAFRALELTTGMWKQALHLYPRPVRWAFERSLHFIARLDVSRPLPGDS
jgi:SAM-dependent methyltransferase